MTTTAAGWHSCACADGRGVGEQLPAAKDWHLSSPYRPISASSPRHQAAEAAARSSAARYVGPCLLTQRPPPESPDRASRLPARARPRDPCRPQPQVRLPGHGATLRPAYRTRRLGSLLPQPPRGLAGGRGRGTRLGQRAQRPAAPWALATRR
ncbi:MAG: hypothetical protein MZV65_37805 [Chromatiales bacterium]|nr:hypothetical protein [Chromatiales bacterium]